ncbi:MAG: histidine kinase N-terminal 7TM domain-containing protein, partial [Dehalococcoidales bacterium]|nr:histidine kinase N-terminal 7TM domain-containing protein [Dehalococcoidales bacterium]
MSINTIIPFVQAVITTVLLVFVLRLRKQTTQTRLFTVFLSSMTLWGLFIGFMRNSLNLNHALYWEKGAMVLITATVVSIYYFAISHERMHNRVLISLPAVYFIAVVVLSFTRLLVEGIEVDEFGNAPVWSAAFYPWLVILYSLILISIFSLWRTRSTSKSYEVRNRYLYLIIGTSLCFVGGILDVLPALGLPIPPGSIYANIGFAVLTSIAILRFHLLDIRIVVRKSVAYLITSTLVAVLYVGFILFFSTVLQQSLPTWAHIFILLAAALLLQAVWQWVQRMVDKMFYRDQYEFMKELEKFSQENHDISNLKELGASLVGLISRAFQTANVHLLLQNETNSYRSVAHIGEGNLHVTLSKRSPIIQWLSNNKEVLLRTQLETDPKLQSITAFEKNDINSMDAEIFIPL